MLWCSVVAYALSLTINMFQHWKSATRTPLEIEVKTVCLRGYAAMGKLSYRKERGIIGLSSTADSTQAGKKTTFLCDLGRKHTWPEALEMWD